jgi:predicted metalloprotease with PDZ domain
MASMSPRTLLPLTLLFLACAPAEPPRCPEAGAPAVAPPKPRASAEPSATKSPAETKDGSAFRLTVTIKPVAESSSVEVEITARGPASDLDEWSIAAAPASLRALHARDIDGPVAVSTSPGASDEKTAARPAAPAPLRIQLAKPPLGTLHLGYTLSARPRSLATTPVVEVDADFFRAIGQTLIALPEAATNEMVTADITIDISDYTGASSDAPVYGAASSFGLGASRAVKARGRELREAAFFMGRMGTALFDTTEGRDEAAWFGYTTFDPRPIAADVASFRTAAGQIFRDNDSRPATFFILPDGRNVGAFVAARRAGGVIVQVSIGEPWSGPVRIAVAAEILKAWIGERLWIGPSAPGKETEAYWFTEGVARHLARDLLFRFGLLAPSELLDEVHGLAGTLATSPLKGQTNASLAARASEPGVLPLLVSRGALYATRVDAEIRAKSGGKTSLDDVLRALYTKAREARGPLPASAWIEAVEKELGEGESDAFAAIIEKGGEIRVPDAALGPCFRASPRRYEAYELGFEEVSEPADPRKIASVRAGGPAERAGLRAGDEIVEAKITRGRSDVPVSITIERGGAKKTITYRPAGPPAQGLGWARKKEIPDESCAR